MMLRPGEQARAILAVAGGAAILGLAPVGLRLSELGPQATAFWRFMFAMPVLAIAVAMLRPAAAARRDVRLLLFAGVLFGLDIALWHAALGLTTVANATLFSNMTPVIAAAAGWLLFGERLKPSWFVGAGLAVLGAFALSWSRARGGQGLLVGDLLAVASMVWYAAYLVTMRGARSRVSAVAAMALTTITAALTAAVATAAVGEPFVTPDMTWRTWAICAGLGVVVHAGGQGFIAWGLGKLPIALSTVLLFVQPVAAAVLGWALFDEPLGPAGLAGAAAILAGVYVVQRGRG